MALNPIAADPALRVTTDLFPLAGRPWTVQLHVRAYSNGGGQTVLWSLGDGWPTPTNYLMLLLGPGASNTIGFAQTGDVQVYSTEKFPITKVFAKAAYSAVTVRQFGGRVSLWLDGREILSTTLPAAFTPTNMALAGNFTALGYGFLFNGYYGNWKVWTRALSRTEIVDEGLAASPRSLDRCYEWWPLNANPPERGLIRRRAIDVVEGSFALETPVPWTRTPVGRRPRRRVLSGAGATPAVPDPAATFAARAARLGGEPLVELFDLRVGYPEARTWYLSHAPIAEGALYPNSPDYQGLVRRASAATQAAAVGGVGGGAELELVVADALGTAGPGGGAGRRWSDWFATPVAGSPDPYDLDAADVTVRWAVPGLGPSEVYPVAVLKIRPESKRHTPGELSLAFGEDPALWGPLPRRKVGLDLYPEADPAEFGQPIPLIFGRRRRVRCLAVDPAKGRYLIGESPTATPLRNVRKVLAVFDDPETGLGTITRLESVSSGTAVESHLVGTTWRSLTVARAEEVPLPKGILLDRVYVQLRPKTGGTPLGRVIVSLEWMVGGAPGGTALGRAAAAEVNAALITNPAGGWIEFKYGDTVDRPPPIWPVSRAVAIRVAYAPESGAGEVELLMDDTGGYLLGTSFEQSQGEWLRSGKHLKLHPVTGDPHENDEGTGSAQQGDTMLDSARGLANWAIEAGEHVLVVGNWYAVYPPRVEVVQAEDEGTDVPPEPLEAKPRAFLCYPITGITDVVTRVLLRLYLARTYHLSGTGVDLLLDEIVDPRPIAVGQYDQAVRTSYGVIATAATVEGTWLTVDVTAAFEAARAEDLSHLCFRLRASNESLAGQGTGGGDDEPDVIGYAIGSAENIEGHRNELKVVFSAGRDIAFQVYGRAFTIQKSVHDATGQGIGLIDFGIGLDRPIIAATVDGLEDDAEGSYTAIPGQLITNGADIARFLLTAPIARGLATSQIDETRFRLARTRLLHADKDRGRAVRPYLEDGLTTGIAPRQWGPLAGIVAEELDVRQWLARLGRCCVSVFYVDALGRVTMWAKGPATGVTALAVAPDQLGSLEQASTGAVAAGLPWTRVEVYYNRDFLALPNTRPKLSVAEWNDFMLIASNRTHPKDKGRETQARLLTSRYGTRSNAGVGAPARTPGVTPTVVEETGFHFLGGELTHETALRVRNDLWDTGSRRPDPFDLITVTLPRLALTLRPMDEITIESYEFSSECDRARPGEVGGIALAPEGWDVPLYRCRRGRFSVRRVEGRIAHRGEFPVHVLASLIGWETP